LPANSKTAFLIDATASGHTKALFVRTTGTEDAEDDVNIISEAVAKQFADTLGYALDPEKAFVTAQTLNPAYLGVEGITVELTPNAGVGPFYLGPSGLPDESIKATTITGIAFFAEVPPGDYTVTFSGKNCEVTDYGWKAKGPGTSSVPAVADTQTITAAFCE
jgi:hypothetical protein